MVEMVVVVEVWWEALEAQMGWEKWGKWQSYHTGCVQNANCSLGNTFWEAVLRKTWALHSGSIVE